LFYLLFALTGISTHTLLYQSLKHQQNTNVYIDCENANASIAFRVVLVIVGRPLGIFLWPRVHDRHLETSVERATDCRSGDRPHFDSQTVTA